MTPSLCGLAAQLTRADVGLINAAVTSTGVLGDTGPVKSPQLPARRDATKSPAAEASLPSEPTLFIVLRTTART